MEEVKKVYRTNNRNNLPYLPPLPPKKHAVNPKKARREVLGEEA